MPQLCIVARHTQAFSLCNRKINILRWRATSDTLWRMTTDEIRHYLSTVQLISFAQTYDLPLRTLTRMKKGETQTRPATVERVIASIVIDQERSKESV